VGRLSRCSEAAKRWIQSGLLWTGRDRTGRQGWIPKPCVGGSNPSWCIPLICWKSRETFNPHGRVDPLQTAESLRTSPPVCSKNRCLSEAAPQGAPSLPSSSSFLVVSTVVGGPPPPFLGRSDPPRSAIFTKHLTEKRLTPKRRAALDLDMTSSRALTILVHRSPECGFIRSAWSPVVPFGSTVTVSAVGRGLSRLL
jgi:hypothetical protein